MSSMSIRSSVRRASLAVDDLVRVVAMRFMLAPAARWLPKRAANVIADCIAAVLVLLPWPGLQVWRDMRHVQSVTRLEALTLTRSWLGRPLRDFIVVTRIQAARESPVSVPVREHNVEGVDALRSSGRSFIVGTAHFTREAYVAVASSNVTPGRLIQVAKAPPPRAAHTLADRRLRLQYGALVETLTTRPDREIEMVYVDLGDFAAGQIYRALKQPGTIVSIHVDAPWDHQRGSLHRPFAASTGRDFAVGATELAQLARCPIVSCVYYVDDDGTVVIEWGDPIDRVDDSCTTMHQLLDTMEVAIGRRPAQYVLQNYGTRQWNALDETWNAVDHAE